VRLYTWRRTGLADEVGSDAMPDAAGGEGGHGAATPDVATHTYLDSHSYTISIGCLVVSVLCQAFFNAHGCQRNSAFSIIL
jgi:hypothetical protein